MVCKSECIVYWAKEIMVCKRVSECCAEKELMVCKSEYIVYWPKERMVCKVESAVLRKI